MNKVLATLSIGTLMALALPGVASARDGDVIAAGKCSASSSSKLKLRLDNGRIETEFEVDQNVVGDTWNVKILDNGTVVARAKATTAAPSGSFTVRRLLSNLTGTDHVKARATNVSTGETCVASAAI